MTATFFDFNGVLVDDEHVHLEAFREVLAPLGIGVSDAAYAERYLGFDDAGAFRAMLHDAGEAASEARVTALVEAKKPVYRARVERGLVVFPGAVELVLRRAARGPIAIVSGALADEIAFALDHMGVRGAFAFVVAAEDTRACKPDPEGYLLARRRLTALAPDEGRPVALEDSLAGVRAAKDAGLRCVGVAHSYSEAELRAAGADATCANLGAVDDATLDG